NSSALRLLVLWLTALIYCFWMNRFRILILRFVTS
ncbi:ABC transporter family protein, partial [Vibrio parahaemolyticus V-223/04]